MVCFGIYKENAGQLLVFSQVFLERRFWYYLIVRILNTAIFTAKGGLW